MESRESRDVAISWRDEQIAMLKTEISRLNLRLSEEIERGILAEARAETAEEALRNLREEVAEWRLTA